MVNLAEERIELVPRGACSPTNAGWARACNEGKTEDSNSHRPKEPTVKTNSTSTFVSDLTKTAAALSLLCLAGCGEMSGTHGAQGLDTTSSRPALGAAAGFAVLGASTVTCTGASAVTGDVGVSPGTGITGFNPPCTISGTIHAGDNAAAQAHADLGIAYNGVAAAVCEHNLSGQDLGGQTLAPGIYCFDTTVGVTGALTLDGGGDSTAVWIFQVGTAITTATSSSVVMAGGGTAGNVFWKVGSSATLGTGTAFQGTLLAYASITLTGGSSVVGRALALNGAVTLDNNYVTLSN
jgi:hypothetical protein